MEKIDTAPVKAYLASLGLKTDEIEKMVRFSDVRDAEKTQIKIEDYQSLLHADQKTIVNWVKKNPALLGLETMGDKPTSVESKLKNLQTLFHTDEASVIKMVLLNSKVFSYDLLTETADGNSSSLKDKIKTYQKLLDMDALTISKMLLKQPCLMGLDVHSDGPTSVRNKLKFYRERLNIQQPTLNKMLLRFPALLAADIDDSPTSVKTRMEKMNALIPAEFFRNMIIQRPALLTVPAQSFKLRFMMAKNMDVMSDFFTRGFMVKQDKVWARYKHITHKHPHVFKLSSVYREESTFRRNFGADTTALMEQYPLDLAAVNSVEQKYQALTGIALKLDEQELASMGLSK